MYNFNWKEFYAMGLSPHDQYYYLIHFVQQMPRKWQRHFMDTTAFDHWYSSPEMTEFLKWREREQEADRIIVEMPNE
jgi:hypothetical protein